MAKKVSKTTKKGKVSKKANTGRNTEEIPKKGKISIVDQPNKNTNGFKQNPQNAGRKRDALKLLEKEIEESFNIEISANDKKKMIGSLLELSIDQLTTLSKNRKAPSFLVLVAGALLDDYNKKKMSNLAALSGGEIGGGDPSPNPENSQPRELILSYNPDDIDVEIIDSEQEIFDKYNDYETLE